MSTHESQSASLAQSPAPDSPSSESSSLDDETLLTNHRQLQNVKGFTFQHFVESWESYLPHLSSRRSTPQLPTADQVVTNQSPVVTNGCQVVTNQLQVVTNEPQVVTNEGQVVTNSQPETDNPNVFNNPAEESVNGNGLVRFLDILTQQLNRVTDAGAQPTVTTFARCPIWGC